MPDTQAFALVARASNFALSAPLTGRRPLLLVLCFYAVALIVQLPGNVPFDGITVWHEAETRNLYAQHPPTLVLVWYLAELVIRGPAFFTVLQLLALWAAAGIVMAKYRPPLWLALCFCAILLAWPPLFAFSAVTVKDVFGGHLALLAVAIALPDRRGSHGAASWAAAFACAVLAALFRYQLGLILPVLALLLWWEIHRAPQHRMRNLAGAIGGAVATYGVVTLAVMALFTQSGSGDVRLSLRKIAVFDIAGAVVSDPSVPLPVLAKAGIDTATLKAEMRQRYTPVRVDTLWQVKGMDDSVIATGGPYGRLLAVPDRALFEQWLALGRGDTGALLSHRVKAFIRVLGIGSIYQCRPIRAGISPLPTGPAAAVQAQSYRASLSSRLMQSRLFPVGAFFRSWIYMVICLAVIAAGMLGAGVPREAMLISAFGLACEASFFFLPQACEVRYSYPGMLAAVFSLALIAFARSRTRSYV